MIDQLEEIFLGYKDSFLGKDITNKNVLKIYYKVDYNNKR